jgi:hypothetical protein
MHIAILENILSNSKIHAQRPTPNQKYGLNNLSK